MGKHFFGILLINFTIFHGQNQIGQMLWRKSKIFRFHRFFFHQTHGLTHQPVGCLLGIAAETCGLLEDICQMFGLGQNIGIIGRQFIFFLISCSLFFLKFRLPALNLFHPSGGNTDWLKIRIREVAVIFRIFFGTHGMGRFLVVIPAAGLLNHFTAFFQKLDLTFSLPVNGMCDCFKRVQVFHLSSSSEFCASHLSHGKVDIGTHRTFLQLTVRYTQILANHAQLFQIGNDFFRCSHIRF